jgi:hypothetical protein
VTIRIIQERLDRYACKTHQEQDLALREITQEIALLSLARTGFFKIAAFHGGTCLRVHYGLPRFSEDLDFLLMRPDPDFDWRPFVNNMALEFQVYGYELEVKDRSRVDSAVKKVFIKDDSIGKLLTLHPMPAGRQKQKINIKLEIDTNPPLGSAWETKYLEYPIPFALTAQDLTSSFSLKIHALLCREYTKGRDWYDFIWYVGRKVSLNLVLLSNALHQTGPGQGRGLSVDGKWYLERMKEKIQTTDFEKVKTDVENFLKADEQASTKLWDRDYFLTYLDRMCEYLN